MENLAPKICLAVDDVEGNIKAIRRDVGKFFDRFFGATCPAEAEVILQDHAVTHLICDYDLGDDHPPGTDLIRMWRSKYPGIRRAVIFSGSQTDSIPETPGVDAVVLKTPFDSRLRDALRIV